MANVAFKKGLMANLPNTYSEGTIYVVTDERALYFDVSNSDRVRIGDFQEFATVAALEANSNPSTTALYYVTEINCLAKWDGSKYVQINLDTGATDVEVNGTGNAITGASYDPKTRKITFTKGTTFMTDADIDTKISALNLANTYYSKSLGEANATAINNIKDGTTIDSFADVEAALDNKQDTIPANTYDAYGAADAVVGTASDTSASETVKGARLLANEKVASVSAGNEGIEIGGTATAPTVGLKLSAKSGNQITIETGSGEEGLYFSTPAASIYSIVKDDNAGEYAAVYHFTKDGVETGAAINIPKDKVVKSGKVETKATAGAWGEAGTYIVIELQNTDDVLYVNVGDLIEYVTTGSQAGDMVVINVDSNHQVTATITDGTVTLAKLHADVQAKINQVHTHANATELDKIAAGDKDKWDAAATKAAANETAITGMKDGTTIDSFGDVETALSGKQDTIPANTYDAYGAANGVKAEVIGANTDDKDADTIFGAKAYADDALTQALTWGSF